MKSRIFPLLRRSRGIGNVFNYLPARVTVVNRYKYDFSVEDGFFEKEMTLLEAKKLPLPVPRSFKHKKAPMDVLYPPHSNDSNFVRFNHDPGFFGRRCFVHDTYSPTYDIDQDIPHSLGFRDEDLDYELPDPISAMHFKRKRSPIVHIIAFLVWGTAFFCYATAGLKVPQKDNPFYYRKKYATNTTMYQMQQSAAIDYSQVYDLNIKGFHRMLITDKGLELTNQGLRFNFANNNDLYC
uniref:Uncharacterized protein n=1 Tax=Euplotes harpa TaxID=151035 RepID=A0A7S3JE96_9SPIT|mmetsp:Transcript_3074/g.3756  ORF Transcript_3074/g.3756 Transcript_3074/m.3756 type:complete len:238 (+) Transcript_3074:1-714(+)